MDNAARGLVVTLHCVSLALALLGDSKNVAVFGGRWVGSFVDDRGVVGVAGAG